MAKFYSNLFCLFLLSLTHQDVICKKRDHSKSHGSKIVGGYNTTIQDVPYQVYLLLQQGDDYYACGGSIISEKHILTAAHCLVKKTKVYVRAGSTDSEYGGTFYVADKFKHHPKYNPKTFDYDVGVVSFNNPIPIDGINTKTISISSRSKVGPGIDLLVSGWGTTSENGDSSETLMAVHVPTVSFKECKVSYPNLPFRSFCAGLPEGGKDACQGDSGGPAVDVSTGVQLGIVSFGAGCARPGYPGVYTNIGSVRSWIKQNTGV